MITDKVNNDDEVEVENEVEVIDITKAFTINAILEVDMDTMAEDTTNTKSNFNMGFNDETNMVLQHEADQLTWPVARKGGDRTDEQVKGMTTVGAHRTFMIDLGLDQLKRRIRCQFGKLLRTRLVRFHPCTDKINI